MIIITVVTAFITCGCLIILENVAFYNTNKNNLRLLIQEQFWAATKKSNTHVSQLVFTAVASVTKIGLNW